MTVASKEVGMGHLMRCLALADMLNEHFKIHFVISTDSPEVISLISLNDYVVSKMDDCYDLRDSSKIRDLVKYADIIVLDFYNLTEQYQIAIKKNHQKLVCIDDLHEIHFYCDLIINVSNSVKTNDYSCESYTNLLLGSNYVLLRNTFLQKAILKPRNLDAVTSVFINMGGADIQNNTLKFLKAVTSIPEVRQIHVVLGTVNPHSDDILSYINGCKNKHRIKLYNNIDSAEMCSILCQCHLAICPASGMSMELCSIGIGIVSGYTADNQLGLLKGLLDSGCAISLDNLNFIEEIQIISCLKVILKNKDYLNKMIFCQKILIDGMSSNRIKLAFQEL